MAKYDIVMPKLGESIIEATITKWLKQEGDPVEEDDSIVEIATDKVDSEIPSPVEGKLVKVLYNEGDVVAVGEVIAHIEIEGDATDEAPASAEPGIATEKAAIKQDAQPEPEAPHATTVAQPDDRFYSPLVKSIASKEGVSAGELAGIQGSGKDNRVTKQDLINYLEKRKSSPAAAPEPALQAPTSQPPASQHVKHEAPPVVSMSGDQVIEMNRMRKLIADHMVMSKQVSPHVTSFVEVDMTRIVRWRNTVKERFLKENGEKITFTPIILEAAAKALREHPGVNSSVDGSNIIIRKDVNIGMATVLPDGNLIVPVIKHADKKNLAGLSADVNDLANRARNNQLKPDEIQGSTFAVSNLGTFGTITGTPVINQPNAAILAIGAIRKMPAVVETPEGDTIAIRQKMILALTYDHRVVDGALGGHFLNTMVHLLENFNPERTV
jgi:2-oxoglutarate dehydrogenase E2 component (dihydrolipoamide succinyltransferase)